MIAVVGGSNITLKRIMLGMGYAHPGLSDRIHSVFNASFTTNAMHERVSRRLRNLPMINRTLVTNKMNALTQMKQRGLGEHIPDTWNDVPNDATLAPERYIVKPYASQAGRGIRRYDRSPIRWGEYLQRDVVKYREFRAHVALWLDNPVFTIQEKKPKPELWDATFGGMDHEYEWPVPNVDMRAILPVTWNIESGFYFKRNTGPQNREEKINRFPIFKRIENVAIRAVKALGYHYGAVDILMDEQRELWIVEVNSHPAIKNPKSVEIYQGAFAPLKDYSASDFQQLLMGDAGTTSHTMTRSADI